MRKIHLSFYSTFYILTFMFEFVQLSGCQRCKEWLHFPIELLWIDSFYSFLITSPMIFNGTPFFQYISVVQKILCMKNWGTQISMVLTWIWGWIEMLLFFFKFWGPFCIYQLISASNPAQLFLCQNHLSAHNFSCIIFYLQLVWIAIRANDL